MIKVPLMPTNNAYNSTMMASFLPVIVNKQTNVEKYAFHCGGSKIHINQVFIRDSRRPIQIIFNSRAGSGFQLTLFRWAC